MSDNNSHTVESDAGWFANWFDDVYYTKLYGHRDTEEAVRAVNLFTRTCAPEPGSAVIDVGCGSGRHSLALRKNNLNVTGLDLSPSLLSLAKSNAKEFPDITWVRQDMRNTFPEVYDSVTSFFTSFGYFENVSDDLRVIQNMEHALAENGTIFFDFLNAETVRNNIVAHDEKTVENIHFIQQRRIQDNCVIKDITISSDKGQQQRTESVRLYNKGDFENMFRKFGLQIRETFGCYDGSTFNSAESDRLIMIVQREI